MVNSMSQVARPEAARLRDLSRTGPSFAILFLQNLNRLPGGLIIRMMNDVKTLLPLMARS